MSKVDELKTTQSGITNQMSGLQDQVNQANLLAEQRNTNAKLMELITGECDLLAMYIMHDGLTMHFGWDDRLPTGKNAQGPREIIVW